MKANAIAAARDLAPIAVIQPMYSLVKRQAEVEILPMAQSEHLAVCPYSPLAAGLLTGKYFEGKTGRLHESEMYRERHKNPEYTEVAARFVPYARSLGVSPAALGVAWVASHPAVTSTLIGARDLEQLNETLGCIDIKLTPEDRAKITTLSIDPPLATDRET
jgi:aryl-alcohol dehydrogenase-like predicted oxidoreductase